MSVSIKLDKREKGPWTNFESYLMKKENEHMGWIDWVDDKSFIIQKNPFSKHPKSPYTYLVPEGVTIPREEGLIRVIPDKIIKEVDFLKNKIYASFSKQFCIVEGYEPIKQDSLPRPYLSKDEFIARLTEDWYGGYSKIFGTELAINLLSCPKSNYGVGGIGAQSFAPYGKRKDLLGLNKSINDLLPKEFLMVNRHYQYRPIKTKDDETNVNSQINRGVSDEISYNYLFNVNPELSSSIMPTQIPIVIPEINYKSGKWGLDRDVLDYQMGAMLLYPDINVNIQDKFVKMVYKIGKELLQNAPNQLPLDNSGLIRLLKAWGRLEYKSQIDEDDFYKMKKDMEEPFKEFFDVIEDAKITNMTYNYPLTPTLGKRHLSLNANKVYRNIKQISREIGFNRITKETIRRKIPINEVSQYDLDNALIELVNAGYLLMFKNYTEFEIVLQSLS